MEQETTTPGRGSPESAGWFRAKLDELNMGPSSFARLLLRLGDDRKLDTILRGLQRMASGQARVSGEMRATLNYLVATKEARERQVIQLQERLDAWKSGRLRSLRDGVDTTQETVREIERQINEARDLPALITSGAMHDEGSD